MLPYVPYVAAAVVECWSCTASFKALVISGLQLNSIGAVREKLVREPLYGKCLVHTSVVTQVTKVHDKSLVNVSCND